MNDISPARILKDVANSIPSKFHELIVVVGSLAAGFHYFGEKAQDIHIHAINFVVILMSVLFLFLEEKVSLRKRWRK
jgi:hypothetical protein